MCSPRVEEGVSESVSQRERGSGIWQESKAKGCEKANGTANTLGLGPQNTSPSGRCARGEAGRGEALSGVRSPEVAWPPGGCRGAPVVSCRVVLRFAPILSHSLTRARRGSDPRARRSHEIRRVSVSSSYRQFCEANAASHSRSRTLGLSASKARGFECRRDGTSLRPPANLHSLLKSEYKFSSVPAAFGISGGGERRGVSRSWLKNVKLGLWKVLHKLIQYGYRGYIVAATPISRWSRLLK